MEQVGVIDLGKWFPAIFGKVFDLKVLSEGNVLYVNLFGLKVSVALSKADAENQQQTDVAIDMENMGIRNKSTGRSG